MGSVAGLPMEEEQVQGRQAGWAAADQVRVFLKILKEISKTLHAKVRRTAGPGQDLPSPLHWSLLTISKWGGGVGRSQGSQEPPRIPLRAQRSPKDTGQLAATNMVCPWG